jgi:hypothetical protein
MITEKRPHDTDAPQLLCKRCGRALHAGRGDFYVVSILAVADPASPVFSEKDLSRNVEHEIQQLLVELRKLDEQQAQDQVYRRIVIYLCEACYVVWIADPTGS